MCMVVGKVFKKPRRLMKCTKFLCDGISGTFYTSVMYARVKADGFIIPRKHRTTFKMSAIIEGGVIHAYAVLPGNYQYNNGAPHSAYAFNVPATDSKNQLVAEALYVPDADKDEKRRAKIVKILEGAIRRRHAVDWQALRKRFANDSQSV